MTHNLIESDGQLSVETSPPAKVGEKISIVFDDCPSSNADLSTAAAEVRGVLSSHVHGQVEITSVIEKIEWGKLDQQPACMMGFMVYFVPPKGRHITFAEYHLRVQTVANQPAESAPLPSVMYLRPEEAIGSSTVVNYSKSKELNPNFQILENAVSLGSMSSEKAFAKPHHWSLSGSPLTLKRRALQVGAKWAISGDKYVKKEFPHCMRLGVVVRHHDQPFQFTLASAGETSSWDNLKRGILRNQKDEEEDGPEIRTLVPDSARSENLLTFEMLEEYVGMRKLSTAESAQEDSTS